MLLTLETKVKEELDIDLSKPVYRAFADSMFYKFEEVNGKFKTTSFDTVIGFDLSVRNYISNEEALALRGSYKEITEGEFYKALNTNFEKHLNATNILNR